MVENPKKSPSPADIEGSSDAEPVALGPHLENPRSRAPADQAAQPVARSLVILQALPADGQVVELVGALEGQVCLLGQADPT